MGIQVSKSSPHLLNTDLLRIGVFGANLGRHPDRPDVGQNSGGVPLLERLPCFPFVELFPLALALFDLPPQLVSTKLIVHPT